jgi:hypothetical protein
MAAFIPSEFSFTEPPVVLAGDQQFISFRPTESGPFLAEQSFNINIASTTHFIEHDSIYLKAKVSFVGGNTSASTSLSSMGLVGCLKDVTYSIGGVQVERISPYNQFVSTQYKRVTGERRNALKELVALDDLTCLSASANKLSKGRYMVHSLENSLGQCNTNIPLAFIRGGVRVSFTLESFNNFVKDNTGAHTNFQLEDVQIICLMTKPSDSYLKAFQSSLEGGRSAKIPMLITKSYQSQLNSTTQQNIDIFCGNVKSLKSVTATIRPAAKLNSASQDAFANDTLDHLKHWYIQNASTRYPQNFYIGVSNDVSEATPDPTGLALAMCQIDSHASGFDNKTAWSANTDTFINYSWGRGQFGAGVQVSDGKFSLGLEFNSAPTTGNQLDVFVQNDVVLEITASDIVLNQSSF